MVKHKYALDVYLGRAFRIIMCFVPLLALGAGINFTCLKLLGFYQTVPWPALIVFDITNVIYVVLGILFAFICKDKEGNLKPKIVYLGKLITSIVIIIQWNYISYMIPSREFWAFFSLFVFVSLFFFDSKYVIHTIGIVLVSIIISWSVSPDTLLPVRDELFIPEIILRCILIVLVSLLMYLFTLVVEKVLIKELEKIAEYDSLTMLRNRRMLSIKMDECIAAYNNADTKFCFLMCDIDDFKVVNDAYGHPFGDIVLKDIARTFNRVIGDKGISFRYGGEEICSLLFLDIDSAFALAETLRIALSEEVHHSKKINVSISMSMGIAEYKEKMLKEDVIKIADSNLYYAKNHGKNMLVV